MHLSKHNFWAVAPLFGLSAVLSYSLISHTYTVLSRLYIWWRTTWLLQKYACLYEYYQAWMCAVLMQSERTTSITCNVSHRVSCVISLLNVKVSIGCDLHNHGRSSRSSGYFFCLLFCECRELRPTTHLTYCFSPIIK